MLIFELGRADIRSKIRPRKSVTGLGKTMVLLCFHICMGLFLSEAWLPFHEESNKT